MLVPLCLHGRGIEVASHQTGENGLFVASSVGPHAVLDHLIDHFTGSVRVTLTFDVLQIDQVMARVRRNAHLTH